MPRRTDPAITKRAISLIARVRKAGQMAPPESETTLSQWEGEFLESLEERLEKYGSAFSDPDKGAMNAPLSLLQGLKLMQIKRKTQPKTGVKSRAKINSKPVVKAKSSLKATKPLRAKKPLLRKSPIKAKSVIGRSAPKV